MKVRPEDILNISFSGALFGYDRKEVDAFLDATAEEMRTLEREKEELLFVLDTLMKRLETVYAKKEEADNREKEAAEPEKNGSAREKKLPETKEKKANCRTEKEDDPRGEERESFAPSRHIQRGTGERSKRSMPTFLRPQPFDPDAAEGKPEANKTAGQSGNGPAPAVKENDTAGTTGTDVTSVNAGKAADPREKKSRPEKKDASSKPADTAETADTASETAVTETKGKLTEENS